VDVECDGELFSAGELVFASSSTVDDSLNVRYDQRASSLSGSVSVCCGFCCKLACDYNFSSLDCWCCCYYDCEKMYELLRKYCGGC